MKPVRMEVTAPSARAILERYVTAWRGIEEMALPRTITLGFSIRGEAGGDYHATLEQDGRAILRDGAPDRFDVMFRTDIDLLRRLDRGEISALTALAQARSSDETPLELALAESFMSAPENRDTLYGLLFHFWNREWPEIAVFDQARSRVVHGANATPLFYARGLRVAWYCLNQGMHINADPADQTNDFDSLLLVTKGTFASRIGSSLRELREGNAVLITAKTPHEFWTTDNQAAEFILIMFGQQA